MHTAQCSHSHHLELRHAINSGSAPYVFKIYGQIHHSMGCLLPVESSTPKFAQLYIHDTENEVDNRIDALGHSDGSAEIDRTIVQGLFQMLDQINDLVRLF